MFDAIVRKKIHCADGKYKSLAQSRAPELRIALTRSGE
jgi:hypothetical protein